MSLRYLSMRYFWLLQVLRHLSLRCLEPNIMEVNGISFCYSQYWKITDKIFTTFSSSTSKNAPVALENMLWTVLTETISSEESGSHENCSQWGLVINLSNGKILLGVHEKMYFVIWLNWSFSNYSTWPLRVLQSSQHLLLVYRDWK